MIAKVGNIVSEFVSVLKRLITVYLCKVILFAVGSIIIGGQLVKAQTGPGGVGNSASNRLWLKADIGVYRDNGVTLATDGDRAQRWTDASGNNNHANQANNGSKPYYRVNAVNNSPGLQFGGNDFMDAGNLNIPGTGGFTVITVFSVDPGYDVGPLTNPQGDKGDYVLDRVTPTSGLASLKLTNGNVYGFQKRDNNANGLGGVVSVSGISTTHFALVNYMRERGTAYRFYLNGTQESSVADGDADLTPPAPRIGRHQGVANGGLKGYITEVIFYDYRINNAQINIVNSYLAAKYDLAIAAANKYAFRSTHKYEVAGIGREDASNLHTDATSGGILNISNPSDLNDGEYMLFGHQNGAIDAWTATEAPPLYLKIGREWKINKTGEPGTVTIKFDISSVQTPPCDKFVLLRDLDGNFSDATATDLTFVSGTTYEVTGISLAEGEHISIGVRKPPVATISPDPAQLCVGGTINLNGNPSGGTGVYVSHAWTGDTSPLSATNIPNPGFSSNTANSYNLTYTVEDANGCGASDNITVLVAPDPVAPGLVKSPDETTVCAGATLTVNVSPGTGGTGSITDEYHFSSDNGVTWSAWSTTIPSLTAVAGTTIIESRRTASGNDCNPSVPKSVSWTVIPDPVAPVISKSPVDATVCAGSVLTVAISAPGSGGTGTNTDEYRYSTNNGTSWSVWSSTVPNFTSVAGTNLVESRRNSTGSGCTSNVNQVSWTVVPDPVAPVISKSPSDATVCAGSVLTVAISTPGSGGTGTNTDEYRYSTDNGASWSPWNTAIPNFTAATGTSLIQSRRNSTGPGCTSNINEVSWVVVADPSSPVISKSPSDATVCEGIPLTISVTTPGSGGAGTNTDEYRYSTDNGISWSPWNAAIPNFTAITGTTFVQSRRNSTGAGCTSNINEVSWVVVPDPSAPVISKNPSDATVCEGISLTISVTTPGSGGSGTNTDEFRYSTNNGTSWSPWSSTLPNFTAVAGTSLVESRRNSTGTGCASNVNQVSWEVVEDPVAPVITKNPSDATVCEGITLTIMVTTPGSGGTGTNTDEFRYSTNNGTSWSPWSSTLPDFIAVAGTSLVESRRNSNGTGCNSDVNQITWEVLPDPVAPVISKSPSDATVCEGIPLTISVITPGSGGAGTNNDEYRYSTDNGVIWSAWSTTLPLFTSVTGTSIVEARRSSTGTGCSSNTNQVTWTIVPDPVAPVISKNPSDAAVCEGSTLTLTVTTPGSGGTGTNTDEYRYSTNNGITWSSWSSTVPNFLAVTGTNLVESRRSSTGAGCSSNVNQLSWTVVLKPVWSTYSFPITNICDGGEVSFSAAVEDGLGGTLTWIRSTTSGGAGITVTSPDAPPSPGTYYYRPHYSPTGPGCILADGTETIVTVLPDPTWNVITSPATDICVGGSLIFSATLNNAGTGTIQWIRSATAGGAGVVVTSPDLPAGGTYYYRPEYLPGYEGCNLAYGTETLVTVHPDPGWNIITPPAFGICIGVNVTFSATLTGDGGGSVQWIRSATPGGAGTIVTSPDIPPATGTWYYRPTYVPGFGGCNLVDGTETLVTVVQYPGLTSTLTPPAICSGSAFSYTPASDVIGTTFGWSRAAVAGITPAGPASGFGDPNEILTNTTTSPVTVRYVYSLTANGCSNPLTFNVDVSVNPAAVVNQPAGEVVCGGAATTAVVFGTTTTGGTVTYTWTNDQPSIGLAAAGSGDIPSFTAVNPGTAPVIATIEVTPHYENGGVTCDGPPKTFTITVNPAAVVNQPAGEVVCGGAATTAVVFGTTTTGGTVTYTWTNDQPSIGLAAAGSGDIPSFTAVNPGTAPVIATIEVTPHYENGGVTCDGPPKTFTITVNPAAVVNQPAGEVVCGGAATTAVVFGTTTTGGTVTYTWTNDQPSIGLAAAGSGDIPSFTAVNPGTAPVIATIEVTPHYENGGVTCDGPPKTFTITVNPAAVVNQPAGEVVCGGAATTAVVFGTTTTGGTVTYTWTNDQPSIGLAAAGSGDIPSFTAVNPGTAPVIATIEVTPHYENGGVTCDGPPKTFTITVNPAAVVNQPAGEVVCGGAATTAVVFGTTTTGGTVTYTWTNDQPSIGLAAAGSGDIPSFTAVNPGTAPVIATIEVTPHYENGGVTCDGPPKTFTITVNPAAVVNQPAGEVVCGGAATTAVVFGTTTTGGTVTYTWTNDQPSIGLAAAGSGDIPSFTAVNPGTAPVIATIEVTPHYENGGVTCDGPPKTFTITVNPAAVVNQPAGEVVCGGAATTAVVFGTTTTGGTVTYTWTNDQPSIGLAAAGSGDIPSFTAVNPGTAPVIATIEVTPHYENGGVTCDGPPKTFTITVNPAAVVNQPAGEVVCGGAATTAVVFGTTTTGGTVTYTWTNDQPSIGLAAAGSGDIPSFTAVNPGTAPVIATIEVTPHYENGGVTCDGPPKTFTITVNPAAVVNQPAGEVVCGGAATTAVVFGTTTTGGTVTYTWTNDQPSIGLAAAGSGDIPSFTAVNPGTAPVIATIEVTPHYENGGVTCDGPPKTFTITVNPAAQVQMPTNQVVCNNAPTLSVLFGTINTGGITTYTWTNDQPSIGLAANGTGAIPSFTALNPGDAPVTALLTVTPHYTSGGITCDGPSKTFAIIVDPTPQVVPSVLTQTICDNGTTDIIIGSPSTYTNGVVTFNYTVTATGGVTGFTTPVIGLPKDYHIEDILNNPTDSPQTVTYTITPVTSTGCGSGPAVVVVTVIPAPQVGQPLNQVLCNGENSTPVSLNTVTTGGVVTYTWTNDQPSIGLTSAGTGDIPSFAAVNPGDSPLIATITVIPHFTFGGLFCDGPGKIFTITINPTPKVVPDIPGQTICDNGSTLITLGSPSTFTAGSITFKFTATSTGGVTGFTPLATGLPNNHVIADVLVNPTDAPQDVIYTITPVSPTGCADGPPVIVTVTVNPTPRIFPVPASTEQCDNTATNIILQSPGTFTEGSVTFKFTAASAGGVTGFTPSASGLPNNHVIADVLVNPTDAAQDVIYTITPVSPTGCADGPSITVTVTVNPTPRISPVPANTEQCDNTLTNIILQSPSIFTTGSVTFKFTATSTGGVSGFTPSATGLPNNHVITDLLVNPTDAPQDVIYTITPVSPTGCADGPSITVTVTVNPTPRIFPAPNNTIQCDSTATNIILQSPSTFTTGTVNFKFTATSLGGVTGFTPSATGLPNNHVITDVLVNPTDAPQDVIYTITPVSPTGCADGPSITVTVTVNPTPGVFPVPANTEQCDSTATNIILRSPGTFTTGVITFNYTATATGGVTGFTPSATGLPNNHVITDLLVNPTDAPQTVTYRVVPVSPTGCGEGPAVYIIVTVNPTPRIFPVPDNTIQCDNTATGIILQSPGTFTTGSVTFKFTATSTGGVTGFTPSATGLPNNHVIADVLVNPTDAPQDVIYTITPVSPTGCADGPSITVTVTVNPTPGISPKPENSIQCDSTTTNILLQSPSTFTSGVITFRYTASATGGVTGFTPSASGLPNNHVIADLLVNPTDAPQTVTYTIAPVSPQGCSDGPAVNIIITINPTPRISPVPDNTIQCDNVATNIPLLSPSLFTSGVVTINTSATAPAGLNGFTVAANGLPNGYVLADNLVNTTDAPLAVTYTLVPVSGAGCSNGPSVTFTATVNPTPRVTPVNVKPAICFGDNTEVRLISPTVMTSGQIRFDYTINVPGGISGNSNPETDKMQDDILSFIYLNYNDSVRSVNFYITPKVVGLACPAGNIDSQEVHVHPKPARGIVITKPFTCEASSGRAALQAVISRGADPYGLVWAGPVGYAMEDSVFITNLYAGYYTLDVTDNLGCQGDTAINIVNMSATPTIIPLPVLPNIHVSCPGGNDGTARIYVRNGVTPPYRYWLIRNEVDTLYSGVFSGNYDTSNPTTFRICNGLNAGQYKLTIRDINGCETYRPGELKEPAPILITFEKSDFSGSNVSCRGYSDGSASSIVSGGNGSYSYFWYPETGSLSVTTTESLLDSIPSGKYYLRIIDLLGCVKTDSVTLIDPPGMDLTSSEVSQSNDGNFQISCNGESDGYIKLTVTGGSGIYTFLWVGPDGYSSTSKDISGLKAGDYICTVTDINGCILVPQPAFTLIQPEVLNIASVSSVSTDGTFNINCYGGTGSIDITVTGGSTGSYVYEWNTTDGAGIVNGQEDQNALRAGTYHLKVSDANGCITESDITLTQPPAITLELVPTHITCQGLGFDNGSVNLTVTGGVGPFSYNWSNGSNTQDISGLAQGYYRVTVTDANSCSGTDSTRVDMPPNLTYNHVLSDFNGYNISCLGRSDGSILIEMTSGTPPFIYSWNGPDGFVQTTKDISGLKAGQYSVLVTDSNLCTAQGTVTLNEPGKLSMNFTPSFSITGDNNINCSGAKTGSITVEAVNNAGLVDYLWADGEIGNIRNDLKAGVYKIIINDSNNCQADSVITLTEPEPLELSFNVTQPFCADMPDGEIILTVTGGIGPAYTYLWSDNSTTQNISTAVSGNYSVTVTDMNGCSARDSVMVLPVNEFCLVIPNAISPNGDLINDVWNIGFKELYPEIEVTIYNRWGEMVWKSEKGYPTPWNGRSNNSILPVDSYHYTIDLHNGSRIIIGHVTIVK